MSDFTVKELNDWYREYAKDHGYYPSELGAYDTDESPFGPIKQVQDLAEGEGGPEHMEVTIQIGDRYFTHYGTWVSWDGAYWNENGEEWFETEPRERIVIDYVGKK